MATVRLARDERETLAAMCSADSMTECLLSRRPRDTWCVACWAKVELLGQLRTEAAGRQWWLVSNDVPPVGVVDVADPINDEHDAYDEWGKHRTERMFTRWVGAWVEQTRMELPDDT